MSARGQIILDSHTLTSLKVLVQVIMRAEFFFFFLFFFFEKIFPLLPGIALWPLSYYCAIMGNPAFRTMSSKVTSHNLGTCRSTVL